MASTDGWLKDKLRGVRAQPGTANASVPTEMEEPVQVAQMTPEQEAWMRKYDPAAMKSKPAPAGKPQPIPPATPSPDPLNIKKSTEERLKGAEVTPGDAAMAAVPLAGMAAPASGGIMDKVKSVAGTVADRAKAAFNGLRGQAAAAITPEVPPNPNVAKGSLSPEGRAFQASRGTFPGGQPLPGSASSPGMVSKGLRFGARAAPLLVAIPSMLEAGQMTGEVSRGEFAATGPEFGWGENGPTYSAGNRWQRGLRILTGGLYNPAGSGPQPKVQPTAMPVATAPSGPEQLPEPTVDPQGTQVTVNRVRDGRWTPVVEDASGRINIRNENLRRDYGGAAAEIRAGREAEQMRGAESAGSFSTGSFYGNGRGLRSGDTAPALRAMGQIAAYGADTRLFKNRAELGLRADAIDAMRENNRTNARIKLGEMARAEEKQGNERLDQIVRNAAIERAGPMDVGYTESGKTAAASHKSKQDSIYAKMRGDLDHTIGKAKMKPGDLNTSQVQLLMTAAKLKERAEAGRDSKTQWARDFFGNKRFDTRDLVSYLPSKAEGSIIPFSGGYKVTLNNGNTVSVTALANGGFNFTGPNDPQDADVMALLAPAIREFEQSKKGKR